MMIPAMSDNSTVAPVELCKRITSDLWFVSSVFFLSFLSCGFGEVILVIYVADDDNAL